MDQGRALPTRQVRSAALDEFRREGLPEVLQRCIIDRVGAVHGLPRLLDGLRQAGLLAELANPEGVRLTQGPNADLYRE